jgi:hypothetical protein
MCYALWLSIFFLFLLLLAANNAWGGDLLAPGCFDISVSSGFFPSGQRIHRITVNSRTGSTLWLHLCYVCLCHMLFNNEIHLSLRVWTAQAGSISAYELLRTFGNYGYVHICLSLCVYRPFVLIMCALLTHLLSMGSHKANFVAVFGEIDIMHYFTRQDFTPGNMIGLAWEGTAWYECV